MNDPMVINATTACLRESSCYMMSVYLHNKLTQACFNPSIAAETGGGEEERREPCVCLGWDIHISRLLIISLPDQGVLARGTEEET